MVKYNFLQKFLIAIANRKLNMTPEELLIEYENGERNFRDVKLPYESNLRGAMLAGADLGDADLRKANLEGAYLSRTGLSRANLAGANLRGADLSGADLFRAYLLSADLSGADLVGADLSGATLAGANLRGADLTEVNLHGAYLVEADLRGVKNLDQALKIGHALLLNTIVTEAERAILDRAREELELYDLRELQRCMKDGMTKQLLH